jgi:16S rRNA (guanine527-N7)-methyltransferase
MSDLGALNVSRETLDKLSGFAELVRKWNPKINLVSKSSLEDLWKRHIVDSAQLFDLAEGEGRWIDLGSGGGFPGIVAAVLNQEKKRFQITLIESDQRKCAFLRTAIRELELSATVKNERIEILETQEADVLSARALTDLKNLLGFCEMHLKSSGVALFPKGKSWKEEDEAARQMWSYECDAITSKTDPDAAILRIKEITRV